VTEQNKLGPEWSIHTNHTSCYSHCRKICTNITSRHL